MKKLSYGVLAGILGVFLLSGSARADITSRFACLENATGQTCIESMTQQIENQGGVVDPCAGY
jgi:hypothetical protein